MRYVWKYPIPTRDRTRHPTEPLPVRVGARPLLVQEIDRGEGLLEAYCWVEQETDNPPAELVLWFIGTGNPSVVSATGCVWHVYWSMEESSTERVQEQS